MSFKLPSTCEGCRWHLDRSASHRHHDYDKCLHTKHEDGYLDQLHLYRYNKKPCPYSSILINVKDSWLWLQLYRKGLEKEEIPMDAEGKEKALVRASSLVMKIAYIADWSIKKYDERMAKRRLLYNVKQAVTHYIQG